MTLSPEQVDRYARQIILKGIGGSGQNRLLQSSVLLVGAGGLGSPVALYLAAAGVGHLVIADGDQIELSNLQRQILHTTRDIGQSKAESAARAVAALNPDVGLTVIKQRISGTNIAAAMALCDVVVDGSDNFDTRYLLNEACWIHKKPLMSAAVVGFEGQVATFRHGVDPQAPCYRCLYPNPPGAGSVPSCTTAGVLGSLAGLVGSLQATETIKELLAIGNSLAGTLLLINVLDGVFHRVKTVKRENCPLCGSQKATKTQPI